MWNPFKSKVNGPLISFMPSGKQVNVLQGTTVLEAALMHKIDLQHSCDGNLACSTCHIYIQQGIESLGIPSLDEMDMLDSAENVQSTSRLACQVRVYANLTVGIPS